jgi:branched-chain amino acid transport system permease protein
MILTVLLFLFGTRRLVNLDIGLVFRAVKDNDQAVRASGMSITFYKAIAVFIASAMGCFGGACLVHIYMWAGMSLFALDFSILPIAATVIGGGGTLVGPVLGCLILVPISELLREIGTLRIVFYSLILVAFIVFRSEGIMVYGQRKYHQFERWVKV